MDTTKVTLAEPRMYKLPEAARLLSRSPRWVREQVKLGRLQAFWLPNMVIPGQSINAFLAARTVPCK